MGFLDTLGGIMDPVGSIVGGFGGIGDAAARVADTAINGGTVGNGDSLFGGIASVGNIVAGAGKLMQDDPNWGGIGDLVAGGIGIAEGTGLTSMGPWGAAIGGGAQALTNGYEAYENFSKGDKDGGWNSVGDASIGALHAGLGSWCPVAELYISAAETGLNLLGTGFGMIGGDDAKFSAGSAVGGLMRGMVGDESMGSWVSDQVGGGTGGAILGGVTNAVAMPLNVADSVTGGVVNTIGNTIDGWFGFGSEGRDDYWGMAKDGIGSGISAVGGAIGDGIGAIGDMLPSISMPSIW
jgi:hypothetical protein